MNNFKWFLYGNGIRTNKLPSFWINSWAVCNVFGWHSMIQYFLAFHLLMITTIIHIQDRFLYLCLAYLILFLRIFDMSSALIKSQVNQKHKCICLTAYYYIPYTICTPKKWNKSHTYLQVLPFHIHIIHLTIFRFISFTYFPKYILCTQKWVMT